MDPDVSDVMRVSVVATGLGKPEMAVRGRWPFGRDVFISDVASRLESVAGVDYVETLMLLLDGTPVGDRAAVPVDRMVVAGPLLVTLSGRSC